MLLDKIKQEGFLVNCLAWMWAFVGIVYAGIEKGEPG